VATPVVAPVMFLVMATLLPQPLGPPSRTIPNPLRLRGLEGPLLAFNTLAGAVILLGVPVAGGSLLVRFRRARGVERLQFRGLVVAAGLPRSSPP
jgi:hypothetical protein